MMDEKQSGEADETTHRDAAGRKLTPQARRALAEAATRRAAAKAVARAAGQTKGAAGKEIGGRDGPDPIRYGDWEKKGIASDF
jgi:hypothetical protein